MLQTIYTAAMQVMAEREGSNAQYCGWGTLIDELAAEASEAGIQPAMINKVLRLAYHGGSLYQARIIVHGN